MEEVTWDDATCLCMLQRGGEPRRQAITVLFRRYNARFIAHLQRRFGCAVAMAEDLAQDTFIKIVEYVQRGGALPQTGKETAWLWTILNNAAISDNRKVAQHLEALDPELVAPAEVEDTCERQAWRAFEADHPERAEALARVKIDGLSVAELAASLGRTYGATREYMSQCRKILRGYLRHWCGETSSETQAS